VSREYRLISGDSHISEPPDLYLDRVPARFRERAPRIESLPQGDAWIIEGARDPINFGMVSVAGLPYEKVSGWVRWADVRRGGYDPIARMGEQDVDRVDAEVLYPSPRVSAGVFFNRADSEFHLAMIRAYNDWLSDYAGTAPDRLVGIAKMPTIGLEAALAELDRAATLPGLGGVLLACFPNGTTNLLPEDDRFWARCQELGWTVNIHVGFVNEAPAMNNAKLPGDVRFHDAPARIMQFIFDEVFERFPRLAIVFAEVDCGWVPYFKEQLADRYKRIHHFAKLDLPRPPTAYFDSNLYYTFITDSFAIKNRHDIGVNNMMWSSDYPHVGSDWPHSWQTIDAHFAGVPEAEKHQILAGNAARLYHLA
jgi:predicted TIM-barrel fold metal-dependent hydrolase